jgi:hypothetical protein
MAWLFDIRKGTTTEAAHKAPESRSAQTSGSFMNIEERSVPYIEKIHLDREDDLRPKAGFIKPLQIAYSAFFTKPERRHLVQTFTLFTAPVLPSLHRNF